MKNRTSKFPAGLLAKWSLALAWTALASQVPAAAQSLIITATAGTSVTSNYVPAAGPTPASLRVFANLTGPASIDLTGTSGSVIFNVVAPAGYRFVVSPTAGSSLSFGVGFDGGRRNPDLEFSGGPTVSYTGLIGTAPVFSNSSVIDFSHGNGSLTLNYAASALTAFSFTSISFSTPVSGIGNDVIIPSAGAATFLMLDQTYVGAAPPGTWPLFSITVIPEPSTYLLLFSGLVVFGCSKIARKAKRADAAG